MPEPRYELADVEARAQAHATFVIPTTKERRTLAVGDCVKLVFKDLTPNLQPCAERLWVKVTKIHQAPGAELADRYDAVLASRPMDLPADTVRHGDPVTFEPRHVCAVERLRAP